MSAQTNERPRPGVFPRQGLTSVRSAPRASLYDRAAHWATEDSPWELLDFVRLARLAGVGGVGLAACWFGAAGEADWHRQIPWIAGGTAAVMVAGFAMVVWLLAGMRQVHRGARALMAEILEDRLGIQPNPEPAATSGVQSQALIGAGAEAGYVIGAGMTRAHRPECSLVRGKQTHEVSAAEMHERALGLCGMCSE